MCYTFPQITIQKGTQAHNGRENVSNVQGKRTATAYNHIEMVMIEQDHAIFRLNICPESKNSFGMVHGGAIYAMADNATGFAAHTDGRNYVTQTSSLHFLRNQPEGEIQADARVRHRGRSTCLVAVDILGEDETLLATGEFTFFCVDMKMMEQRVKNSL